MKAEIKDDVFHSMVLLKPETDEERKALHTLQRRGVYVCVSGTSTGLCAPAPNYLQLNITPTQLSVLMYVLGRSDEHMRSLPENIRYPYTRLMEDLDHAIGIHGLGGSLLPIPLPQRAEAVTEKTGENEEEQEVTK